MLWWGIVDVRVGLDRGGVLEGPQCSQNPDCNQPPSHSGTITHDINAKRYTNPAIKIFLVIPGEPDLTQALLPYMIPANRFVVGTDQENDHTTIKQGMYDILINSLYI